MEIPRPPDSEDLRVGHNLIAGMSSATVLPDIDFETRSMAGFIWDTSSNKFIPPRGSNKKGLQTVGMAVYAEHPSTEVICMAYDLKDGFGSRQWKPGDFPPTDLFIHIEDGGLLEAWNVAFEYYIWNFVCVNRYGYPPLNISSLRCAAAKSRAYSLPGSLAACGKVLDVKNGKLSGGKRLIKRYCEPHNPTKKNSDIWNDIRNSPSDYQAMMQYNLVDIKAEAEISNQVPDLSPQELEFWQADQRINRRGVRLDRAAIESCIKIVEQAHRKYNAELVELTNGEVTSISQVARLIKWMSGYGVYTKSIDEANIELLMSRVIPRQVYRALELRRLIGSAAVKKLFAMINRLSADDRVRDLFVYHTARTGRTGGEGVQPHNLPNSNKLTISQCPTCRAYSKNIICLWCEGNTTKAGNEWNHEAINNALEIISAENLNLLEMYFGEAIVTISGCLRGMFISAEKHDLVASDYSSIESVVIAELAGEGWRQEVFRTHGKIYEMSAAKISNVPFQTILDHKKQTGKHHELRKLGKVAELASSFGGWLGSWLNFKADEFLNEEQIKVSVLAWRDASPMIVKLWRETEICAHMAVQHPGQVFTYRMISYERRGAALYCKLPSGRYLTYHRPQLAPSIRRPGTMELSFEGWNTNPKNGAMGWVRMTTFGARLVENNTQAVARDILAHAIVNLEKHGYPVVLHVHDEIVCEIPEGVGSVDELESIMMELPQWATGWPIKAAGGWRAKRYRK